MCWRYFFHASSSLLSQTLLNTEALLKWFSNFLLNHQLLVMLCSENQFSNDIVCYTILAFPMISITYYLWNLTKFVLILMAPLCLRASSVGVPSPSMCFIYMRYAQPCFNSGRSVILWVTKGRDAKYFLESWSLDEERTSVPCSLCLSHQDILDSLTGSSISYLSFSLQPLQCKVEMRSPQ